MRCRQTVGVRKVSDHGGEHLDLHVAGRGNDRCPDIAGRDGATGVGAAFPRVVPDELHHERVPRRGPGSCGEGLVADRAARRLDRRPQGLRGLLGAERIQLGSGDALEERHARVGQGRLLHGGKARTHEHDGLAVDLGDVLEGVREVAQGGDVGVVELVDGDEGTPGVALRPVGQVFHGIEHPGVDRQLPGLGGSEGDSRAGTQDADLGRRDTATPGVGVGRHLLDEGIGEGRLGLGRDPDRGQAVLLGHVPHRCEQDGLARTAGTLEQHGVVRMVRTGGHGGATASHGLVATREGVRRTTEGRVEGVGAPHDRHCRLPNLALSRRSAYRPH